MLKTTITLLMLLALISNAHSQEHLWYENETNTSNIRFEEASSGAFSINKLNPKANGINPNLKVSKFVREANNNSRGFSFFKLFDPIEVAEQHIIRLKAFVDLSTEELKETTNRRLRVYLENTTNSISVHKQLVFEVGKEWQEFTFVFDSGEFTSEGLANGGYDQMYIGYGDGKSAPEEIIYYIDSIHGSIEYVTPALNPNIEWMQGSWGTRLYVRGGEELDDYVDNRGYDYVAGAQEIIDKYSTIGHVITNATNNARSHLFTLRTNENLDAVMGAANSVITEEFVPSIENEQIIIDVITIFKNAGKKVILYLNSLSPGARSTAEGAEAWNAYVEQYFNGNEHLAWTNLCEGYVKRFAELGVDGYWLDAFASYPGTDDEKAEFVQMFRNVDPDIVLAANFHKTYFTDDDGQFLRVESDGVDDEDDRSYRIIKLAGNDPFSDFTPGHITPLGQGAPPNSWAYEEYTIPDVQDSGLTAYDYSKSSVKHLFMPIRETWSGDRTALVYDGEQAYRFVKKITDGGGSITFSNTTNDGTIMEDEDEVLKFVNEQMLANATPAEYSRPEGAFLVGESITLSVEEILNKKENNFRIKPNPVVGSFELSKEFSSAIIYSLEGTKIVEFTENKDTYDVSELATGFYLLKVIDKTGDVQIIRFVKK